MLDVPRYLVFLHVFANLVWIGAITSVAVTLIAPHGSSRDRGAIALTIYRYAATPAFLASLVMGLVRLVMAMDLYFVQTKFMHGKLAFAVGVIALHHIIGGAAKRMASGQLEAATHAAKLIAALLVCSLCVVFFAVVKPF